MTNLPGILRSLKALAPSTAAADRLAADLYRAHAANRAHTARRQIDERAKSAIEVIKATAGVRS